MERLRGGNRAMRPPGDKGSSGAGGGGRGISQACRALLFSSARFCDHYLTRFCFCFPRDHRGIGFAFLEGRVDLSGPGGGGLASSSNSSSWPTLGTCSPSVRSTGSTEEGTSHFAWDLKISHASS
ncbi:hypothetical protein Tco_0855718 [Tanacetum coccineum]